MKDFKMLKTKSSGRKWAFWGAVLGLLGAASSMGAWEEHAMRNVVELVAFPAMTALLAADAARWRNRS